MERRTVLRDATTFRDGTASSAGRASPARGSGKVIGSTGVNEAQWCSDCREATRTAPDCATEAQSRVTWSGDV